MAYSSTDDLLIGDLLLGEVDPQRYVDDAFKEINSKLGPIYATPIAQADVPEWAWDTLVRINNFLATGRLLLATTQSGEQGAEHAYGLGLVKEAQADLYAIQTGALSLQAPIAVGNKSGTGNAPTVLVGDRQSGVDTFYDLFTNSPIIPPPFNPYEPYWRPGPRGGMGSPSSIPAKPPPAVVEPATQETIGEEGEQEGVAWEGGGGI